MSDATPLIGAGFAGTPWQENVVEVALVTSAAAMLALCALLLRGLGRRTRA
jgi:hypothetical protein